MKPEKKPEEEAEKHPKNQPENELEKEPKKEPDMEMEKDNVPMIKFKDALALYHFISEEQRSGSRKWGQKERVGLVQEMTEN